MASKNTEVTSHLTPCFKIILMNKQLFIYNFSQNKNTFSISQIKQKTNNFEILYTQIMESNIQTLYRNEHQSHVLFTLNKQIQALAPIRVSYQNLTQYHERISVEMGSMLEQHDYAIASLKANVQTLEGIFDRTEQERNDLVVSLRQTQNEYAKVVLDTRNTAQKYETLNQKLALQQSRTTQNKAYQDQLYTIQANLQGNVIALQTVNKQLGEQHEQLLQQQSKVNERIIQSQQQKQSLQQKNYIFKQQIAKMTVKNDDMIDGNRKLSEEIRQKEQAHMQLAKQNLTHKQKLIQLKSSLQGHNNQISYKRSLIAQEQVTETQLTSHCAKLEQIIGSLRLQAQTVGQDNAALQRQISELTKTKLQNTTFLQNSQRHLEQIKRTNQMLLAKMEECCKKDKEVESLLIRKLGALETFARRLGQKYEEEQGVRFQAVLFRERAFNQIMPMSLGESKLNKQASQPKLNRLDSQSKKQTNSSQKPWLKQNLNL